MRTRLVNGESVMALGKRKDAANFMPVAKYDARIGRFTLVDRVTRILGIRSHTT
jgi:hypothetical protein